MRHRLRRRYGRARGASRETFFHVGHGPHDVGAAVDHTGRPLESGWHFHFKAGGSTFSAGPYGSKSEAMRAEHALRAGGAR